MKKILIVTLAAMIAVALIACSAPQQAATTEEPAAPAAEAEEEASEEPVGMPNPIEEVESGDVILERLEIFITVPEGATDVQYSIIAERTAQVDFKLDGIAYNHRIQKTAALEDISGVYAEFETEKDMEWVDYPYHIRYNEGGEGLSQWYDELAEASYSVYMESGANEAALQWISEALIPAS